MWSVRSNYSKAVVEPLSQQRIIVSSGPPRSVSARVKRSIMLKAFMHSIHILFCQTWGTRDPMRVGSMHRRDARAPVSQRPRPHPPHGAHPHVRRTRSRDVHGMTVSSGRAPASLKAALARVLIFQDTTKIPSAECRTALTSAEDRCTCLAEATNSTSVRYSRVFSFVRSHPSN